MVDLKMLEEKTPILKEICSEKEVFWKNPDKSACGEAMEQIELGMEDVEDAERRLERFAPFIMKCFPETKERNGIIESVLTPVPKMKDLLNEKYDSNLEGNLLLKQDSHLAIAGSIKARGGIYEILKHTEELALEHGILSLEDNYEKLASEECREFFKKYTIQVGSTGNLGLSIGIMSAAVGYQVIVHMSADAKQWKKDLLRSHGVTVKEYESDYSEAVKNGRALSDADPNSYFVDDENSKTLFLGYAVAAKRLQKQLEEEEKLAEAKKESSLLRDRVTEEEIANIVARWTGIPVEKLVEGEREKLLHLDDVLHKRVIGQDEAVTKVSEAILRSRAGIANPNRPIGSFLFLGPTGVGKTELAKALAQALFDDERNMVRIDMTEYMEKFSVSRLIGAPPGYVGYEEGGQLTEAVRRKPYSVVLFDEVEKAHPDVFNILLQVLDDGRITDSQGRTVDFKNTVIILTSNLGSDIILNDLEQRRAEGSNELSEDARKQIDLLLKSKFRPEFLNRLDEIVYYKSLTKDETRKIVDLQLEDLRKRMDEGKHLKLDVTTAAKDFIIDSSYDSVYGARPIKRFIQSRVETLIAKAIIQGSYTEGATLTVDYDGTGLVLR